MQTNDYGRSRTNFAKVGRMAWSSRNGKRNDNKMGNLLKKQRKNLNI